MIKQPLIELQNISFQYDYTKVLSHLSLSINEGDFVALLGPNGSGKSTLLKIILGLLKPTTGTIHLFGEEATKFKKREWIGYVSQKANAFNGGFPATVKEVVASGLTKKLGLFKRKVHNQQTLIEEALQAVDMLPYLHRNIGELSGGQQQRVFIARALIAKPKMLILDEPTVGVDQENVAIFYDLMEKLNNEGMTVVLVTHDMTVVESAVTNIACLNGKIHYYGPKEGYEALTKEQISAWYSYSVEQEDMS